MNKLAIGMAAGTALLALSTSFASAAIVCSADECWHATEVYEYPRESGIVVHPDNWRWAEHEHFKWHEHEGRGYWHGGAWHGF